jgi:hypothetical protein
MEENNIENIKDIVGYKKETIENILNLLNIVPVKAYVETQAKMKIYDLLMDPDYSFENKQDPEK